MLTPGIGPMILVAINLHSKILYYLAKQPIIPMTIILNLRHFS